MRKFILMALTLFAFAFAGCGKSAKDECNDKEDKEWDAENKKCTDKEAEDAADATEAVYTITNLLADAASLASGDATMELAQNGCAKVKESQFAALKVSVGDAVLCDGTDTIADDPSTTEVVEASANNDCAAGNYNVASKADGSGTELAVADAANEAETCADLASPATEEAEASTEAEAATEGEEETADDSADGG